MRPELVIGLALAVALAVPGAASAASTTFGSDLSAPATLDTATGIQPQPHSGSDTYLWNTRLANGSDPRSPASGQITDIKLKGCTNADKGPVAGFNSTRIEFQDLLPQPDGSFLTQGSRTAASDAAGRPFSLPLCDTAGGTAGPNTVTDYHPVNLCTTRGDSVDVTDNGGFDPQRYPQGIPYQLLARVPGSSLDSYVLYPGGQEKVFKPGDVGLFGGFYMNPNEELLLQATVGTGADGTGLCRGGGSTGGAGGGGGGGGGTNTGTGTGAGTGGGGGGGAVRLYSQRDRVNRRGRVRVSIFCGLAGGCDGTAALETQSGKTLASKGFSITGNRKSKVALRLKRSGIRKIRRHHRRLKVTLSVTVGGQTATQLIKLKL